MGPRRRCRDRRQRSLQSRQEHVHTADRWSSAADVGDRLAAIRASGHANAVLATLCNEDQRDARRKPKVPANVAYIDVFVFESSNGLVSKNIATVPSNEETRCV